MSQQLHLMLQQAIQAFQNGNLDSANAMLTRLLNVDPKNLPALHVIGLVKAAQGNYKESADYLGQAVRLNPNDPSIQYNLAKALIDCGEDKRALPHHKRAVELNPHNPQAWLNYGKSAFNLQQLANALSHYDQALQLESNYYEAWMNKGVALHALERFADAHHAFEMALSLNPNSYEALNGKGIVLHALGRYEEALSAYEEAIALHPDYFEALNNKGITLHALGRHDEALSLYDKALRIKPNNVEALINKGITLQALQYFDNALSCFDAALDLNQSSHQAWLNRGLLFFSQKNYDEALSCYSKALAISPKYYEAVNNIGLVLKHKKRYVESLQHFDLAIEIYPNRYDSHSNRANVLYDLREYELALAQSNIALNLKPNFWESYNNRGLIYIRLGRLEEAIQDFNTALGLAPNNYDIWNNKGYALHQLNKNGEAIECYDRTIGLKPDFYDALWNKSLALLVEGDFENGFALYENRWKSEKIELRIGGTRKFDAPLWLGQDSLNGKTLLVYGEQGLGDFIQFCRYVHLLVSQGATVVLETPKALFKLLGNLRNLCHIICDGDDLPFFDYHCPILSLPLAFKTTLATIPNIENYLNINPDLQQQMLWQSELRLSKKPLIGLVWSGNSVHQNDHNRSIPLKDIVKYLPPHFNFICLQKDIRPEDQSVLESTSQIRNFVNDLHDFADTASLMNCLDLIVTVDTSVAHLGGAMGIKTLLLLPYAPDWRWLLNRGDSPWYPSMKLYRQAEIGNWHGPLNQMSCDLERLIKT